MNRGLHERWRELVFGFVCVFAGLALPSRGLGPLYVGLHAALGNALLPASLDSGVALAFQVTEATVRDQPWSLPLVVTPPLPRAPVSALLDMRTLAFLPTACFVALAAATPLASRWQNVRILLVGLGILETLLLLLNTLPVLTFLGGAGPVAAIELSVATQTALQVLYRALVASPGMAYAIPFFLWWVLVRKLGDDSEFRTNLRNPKPEPLPNAAK